MHKIRIRPGPGPEFPTHNQSFATNSTAGRRSANRFAISSTFTDFRSNILLALLIVLTFSLAGCSGYVPNSGSAGSPSANSHNGSASLSGVSCGTPSLTVPGTQGCSVSLNAPAAKSFVVRLSSNNKSLSLPTTVTVSSGATSAGFDAVAAAVPASQSVTLTATAHGVSQTFVMQLNPGTSASTSAGLSVSATSLSFGEVLEGIPNTLPVTLTAGTAPVNISGVTVTGTGFSVSGLSTPSTLSPGQSATLEVQFEPTATGTVTGQLSVATNAQTGPAIVSLTGTGASHEVELSWNAPSTSGSVAGYHIYRSPSGAASYQLMNSSVDTQTTYIDPTVQSGQSYDYMVKSIDGAGVESSPSNIADVVIP